MDTDGDGHITPSASINHLEGLMSDHLTTIGTIYTAFGQGDIPTILNYLDDEVQWEAWAHNYAQRAGVPWLKPRMGKASVLEFFQIVGGFQISDFRVLSMMAGGNQVAVEVVIEADIPATGGHLRDEELHLWTFNEAGKVVRMRHYNDTAKHIAAAEGQGHA